MTYVKSIFLFGLINFAFGSEIPTDSLLPKIKHYLLSEQVLTKTPGKMVGEWPSYMMNERNLPRLGWKGKKAYDSNAFLTANLFNILARAYLTNPQNNQDLLPTLVLAQKNLEVYRTGETYGFWPFLERPAHLHQKEIREGLPIPKARLPVHYFLDAKATVNAANVPDDADDTAVAYLSLAYYEEIRKTDTTNATILPELPFSPSSLANIVDQYRDRKRRSLHYYNVMNGAYLFTGAYMTWFTKEPLFTPWSWRPASETKSYLTYGANEIDCVVNANVLIALQKRDELEKAMGHESSCRFLKKVIQKNQYSTCGVYYPNRFHATYVFAKSIYANVACLQDETSKIMEFVLAQQNEDGSFSSPSSLKKWKQKFLGLIYNTNFLLPKLVETPDHENYKDQEWLDHVDPLDRIQSTAYAINSLLHLFKKLDKKDQGRSLQAMESGMKWLISQSHIEKDKVWWDGGVFFSGGTIVREYLKWRSDAYTTAVIFETMALYESIKNGTSYAP